MIRRLRALWDPRLALLLVPVVAVGVLVATTGSGAQSSAKRPTSTTTTVAPERASSQSPITVPPTIPADAPTVTAPDVGDNDPVAAAVRNRAATVRAARAAMGEPIPASPNSTSGLVVGADGAVPTTLAAAPSTTVAGAPSTTIDSPTTTVVDSPDENVAVPDPVVAESGSPLVLLLVALGAAAVVGFGLFTRRRPARNA